MIKIFFEITEHKTPNLSTGKRTMGDAISILCKEEFAKDQIIEVYAYGRKGNEKTKQLAGKLIVKANDKKHQHTINVALVNVITEDGHKDEKKRRSENSMQIKKIQKGLDQCYVNVNIVEKEMDVTPSANTSNSFYNFMTHDGFLKSPIRDDFFSFLENYFLDEFPSFNDYYKIFIIDKSCKVTDKRNTFYIKGQARGKGTREVIILKEGIDGYTGIHELLHTFGLYHSFSNSNNYIWERYGTDNIMDYVRDKDIRIAMWQYQWKTINPNME